ncbi:type II toxin-antitoxin system RatA family toxin [Candidatus Coxiella mudrowiae]|uniref:type II toxin-antitoxin system RatA family toxin n=1 Tax=Candidatus Coxiella mudrowiae TaxID=2054173 RepID=UPI000C2918B0|nr:type II toxin-antitoxin system RatA family toxin [Candidatus Coxiella mudrowiae]
MPDINKSKVVPYGKKEMYKLISDIESYPQFVPFCSDSQINSRTDDEIRATLSFSKGGLNKSFTTLNRLQPHKMVEIRLVNGPFRQLEGFWQFKALERGGCRVLLDLEFEFSSRWLALMFGPLFNQVATMLVDAFCKRADIIYGKNS